MKTIGINTLVYKNDLEAGKSQAQLCVEVAKYSTVIEVRREFIKRVEEFDEIRKEAKNNALEVYYSIPEKITINKALHPQFYTFLSEAKRMCATHIKFNMGDLHSCDTQVIQDLNKIMEDYQIFITIENDQTKENGTLDCAKSTFTHLKSHGSKIGFTYDAGNWYWQNESPMNAFDIMKSYIQVYHLKNVKVNPYLRTVLLEEGCIAWKSMINMLSDEVTIILEYPMCKKDIHHEVQCLKNAIQGGNIYE